MTDLSPAAQAVRKAYYSTDDDLAGPALAAALRAAAEQLPDVVWDDCIKPDDEVLIGIDWSHDALHALAAELEGQ